MKLLHTADWQFGLRLNLVGGDTAARLRSQRYDTIRTIARLALDEAVDMVVVAGDVFDDNRVGRDTLQQARDAIGEFGEIPLILLPGNHDAATPDSALARLPDLPASVIVPLQPQSVTVAGVELLLCPLCERHKQGDLTAWSEPVGEGPRSIRGAVAHGGVLDFAAPAESVNRIRVPELLAKGIDYVALGDWHGLYPINGRAGYSGAHEAIRFREQNTGNVLLVEIDGPGALASDFQLRGQQSAGGVSEPFEQLSAGAREPLALLVRIGLSEVLGVDQAWPLVLDDVLVNTDRERIARLQKLLYRASRNTQIILFTCHGPMFDALGADPVIHLPPPLRAVG